MPRRIAGVRCTARCYSGRRRNYAGLLEINLARRSFTMNDSPKPEKNTRLSLSLSLLIIATGVFCFICGIRTSFSTAGRQSSSSVSLTPENQNLEAIASLLNASKTDAALLELVKKLTEEKDCQKLLAIRREIYRLGKIGHDFLVEAVADSKMERLVFTFSSSTDSFHLVSIDGPCYVFVNVENGVEKKITDLTEALDARLLHDDDYLDRFVKTHWANGHGIFMEECVDELTRDGSTPASRRIAHRYLRDYQKLSLNYDPTLPVSQTPPQVKERLSQWKKDHFNDSMYWHVMEEHARNEQEDNTQIEAEILNLPSLHITAADVPEPKNIPFKDEKDRAAYINYYKRGYLRCANSKGMIGMSCCLGDTPNRHAKIEGHYQGVSDANDAKRNAAKQKIGKKSS
jgi:hypothetical protein